MKELYELKEMLCKELEEYGKKGDLTAGSLDVIDKLAHATKNLDKIIEVCEEEEYSGAYAYEDMGSNRGGGRSSRGGSYRMDGGSYARGRRRDSMGRYSRMNGYSRHGEMVDELRELMADAPDERTRMEIQKLVDKMEQM